MNKESFQLLKPPCVKLNETAIDFRAGKIGSKELTASLDQLLSTLRHAQKSTSQWDDGLADYVFFPLSHIFRDRQTAPVKALELCLQCLELLLQTGWRKITNPELGVQLLILLTFLAGSGSSNGQERRTSDDLQAAALSCEAALFSSVSRSPASREDLQQTQNVPALGHAVTVLIEGVKDGASAKVQLCAIHALHSFLENVADREMLLSFFPGTVSSLTQVLTPNTKSRRSFKVLEASLNALSYAFQSLLSDSVVASSSADPAWFKATSAQIKLALANIVRLRRHDRAEVRHALINLCWTVVQDCEKALLECSAMVLETIIDLVQREDNDTQTVKRLEHVLATNPQMAELLRDTLYDRLISLPRIMQSNDDAVKTNTISHVSTSYSLLIGGDLDMSIIDGIVLSTITDSLTNAIHVPAKVGVIEGSRATESTLSGLLSLPAAQDSSAFSVVLTGNKSGMEAVQQLEAFVRQIAGSKTSLRIAGEALENAQYSQGDSRLVNIWLSFTILKERAACNNDIAFDDYVDVEPTSRLDSQLCQELYSYALALLTQEEYQSQIDWRQQALALEAVAFQATRARTDFRVELVDVLYPVVHLLGYSIQPLRNHAMKCLNLIASSCGYKHAQDMLISNVDYLVNAVSVKINTFDISPEAPQVLLMMIKLCGPKLLVYLDDLVDGIFEALECFHGYQSLVELLFSVLKGVVEEGAKSSQFMITMDEKSSHRKVTQRPTKVEDVIAALRQARNKSSKTKEEGPAREDFPERTPRRPWTHLSYRKERSVESDDPLDTADEEEQKGQPPPDKPAPLTKTYTLLARITRLTQHHLPSSSPHIRISLLTLLTTSLPYLAHHDDTFLPIVHTLWPVLTPRLEDKEAYVVAGTLDVLGSICEGAGDFVSQRIEGLWPVIRRIWKEVEAEMRPDASRSGDIGRKGTRAFTASSNTPRGLLTNTTDITLRGTEIDGIELLRPATSSTSTPTSLLMPLSNIIPVVSDALTIKSTLRTEPHSSQQLSSHLTLTSSTITSSSQTPYIATPTHLLHTALVCFLTRLLCHVRITEAIYSEVLHIMLYKNLIKENPVGVNDEGLKAKEVSEALKSRNPDAVWLALERVRARDVTTRDGTTPRQRRVPGGIGMGWLSIIG